MGEVAAIGLRDYIPDKTISCQLWIGGSLDQCMWQCGIFVINYHMLDLIALELYC